MADGQGGLAERIAQLEAENDALSARIRTRGSRWRAPVSAVLIVLGLVLGSASTVTSYARDMLADTDAFVAAFGPLAADPDVQQTVTAAVGSAIDSAVDVPALTGEVFDGLRALDLPPKASAALTLLEAPAGRGVQSLIHGLTREVIASPAFSELWTQALRATHGQLTAALRGEAGSVIAAGADGALRLELGPVLAGVRDRLLAEGMTFASAIPAGDRSIVLVQDSSLGAAVAGYGLLIGVAAWLPWIALALLAAGVLVARRRRGGLMLVGIAAAVIMTAFAAGAQLARAVAVGALSSSGSGITPAAAGSVFDQVSDPLVQRILAIALLGGVVAVVSWATGPRRAAAAVRGAASRAIGAIRPGEAGGGRWGAVRVWVERRHVPLLVLVAVLATATVLLVHPLTAGLVLWTTAAALVALLAIEAIRAPGGLSRSRA
ncbi:hypothetical protein [Microbacterium sp.]|uniref:hypothetical protein n=1 Tax=Microbacterium sp. TaxID=51671 RepID=UPI0033421CA4